MSATDKPERPKKRMSLALRGAIGFGVGSALTVGWLSWVRSLPFVLENEHNVLFALGFCLTGIVGGVWLNSGLTCRRSPLLVAVGAGALFAIPGAMLSLPPPAFSLIDNPGFFWSILTAVATLLYVLVGFAIPGTVLASILGRGLAITGGLAFGAGALVGVLLIAAGSGVATLMRLPVDNWLTSLSWCLAVIAVGVIGGTILGAALDRQEKRDAAPQ